MRIARTVSEVRAAVDGARTDGRVVVLVPTMGFLHEGHLSLARIGRDHVERTGASAHVVLSIFVNPTQFGPHEDFERYPRDEARDADLAVKAGVDLVFAPDVAEVYPDGFRTRVQVEGLSEPLCGAGRPGHFDGVALVVSKLLNMVRPDVTVFGQKDAQQAVIVRRLAADLNLPGEILLAPIVREEDGVAMSSRNAYLSPEERVAARAIPRGLRAAADAFAGGVRDGSELTAIVRRELESEALLRPEYVEVVRPEDLEPWEGAGPALLVLAVRAGRTRLIDNLVLGAEPPQVPATIPEAEGRGESA